MFPKRNPRRFSRPARITSGKCEPCGAYFSWEGPVKLRDAKCPKCGAALVRTCRGNVRTATFERIDGASLVCRPARKVDAVILDESGKVICPSCSGNAAKLGRPVTPTQAEADIKCGCCLKPIVRAA